MLYKYSGSDYKEANALMSKNSRVDLIGQLVFEERDGFLEIDEKDISKLL